MERINRVNLQGKTPEEAVKVMEKWMNETADRINHSLSHLDETNFIEGKAPVMQQELQDSLNTLMEQTKRMIAKNKGE